MSIDTKIYIPSYSHDYSVSNPLKYTVKKIREAILTLPIVGNVKIKRSVKPNYPITQFKSFEMWDIDFTLNYDCDNCENRREQRTLSVYFDHYTVDRLLSLKIGCWGHNELIAAHLVNKFGGYANFNDCDSIEIDYVSVQPVNH